MIKEAIILAGGLGTRLRSVVSDVPKCMAPVAGKPFLHYIIESLLKQHVTKFIFSVGYKHESIAEYLKHNYKELDYQLAVEESPLGTGGAILLASAMATGDLLLVFNGDTYFDVDIAALYAFHQVKKSNCTLSLKPMADFDRYGVVVLNQRDQVVSFLEKKYYLEGLINGGVYLLNKKHFLLLDFPDVFSFEKDYLEKYYTTVPMYGLVQREYFIDIGIPEDYEKAGNDFSDF